MEIIANNLCFFFFIRHAFIEFSGHESVPTALQYNGVIFGGKCLKWVLVEPNHKRISGEAIENYPLIFLCYVCNVCKNACMPI